MLKTLGKDKNCSLFSTAICVEESIITLRLCRPTLMPMQELFQRRFTRRQKFRQQRRRRDAAQEEH
jgi:hypothetical protein